MSSSLWYEYLALHYQYINIFYSLQIHSVLLLCILHGGKILGLFLAIVVDNLLKLQADFSWIRPSIYLLSFLTIEAMFCVDSHAGSSA